VAAPVHQATPDQLAQLGCKARKAFKASLAQLEPPEPMAQPVQLVPRVPQALMVPWDQPAHKASRAFKASKALWVQLGQAV